MTKTILDIVERQPEPAPWSEGDNIPWNDPGFSERMLAEHLSQEHDLASRRNASIDEHCEWIFSTLLGGRSGRVLDLGCGRGEFLALMGPSGSGKTTLLRTLLGLLPADAGEIRWNGAIVDDPATLFVPPRCAYTAQVPLLFSESLRDNILMGLPQERVDVDSALRLAVLAPDLEELEHGLDTVIGAIQFADDLRIERTTLGPASDLPKKELTPLLLPSSTLPKRGFRRTAASSSR